MIAVAAFRIEFVCRWRRLRPSTSSRACPPLRREGRGIAGAPFSLRHGHAWPDWDVTSVEPTSGVYALFPGGAKVRPLSISWVGALLRRSNRRAGENLRHRSPGVVRQSRHGIDGRSLGHDLWARISQRTIRTISAPKPPPIKNTTIDSPPGGETQFANIAGTVKANAASNQAGFGWPRKPHASTANHQQKPA